MAGERLVARDGRLVGGEAREPRRLDPLAVVAVEEDRPGQVGLGAAERHHLPVEHGRRARAVEDDVADARVTPQQHRRLVGGSVLLEPRERGFDRRLRLPARCPREVAAVVGELALETARAELRLLEEAEAEGLPVEAVDLRDALDPAPPDRLALRGRGFGHPAARVVRRLVGRHAPGHARHHVERRAQHAAILGLEPQHPRHGNVRPAEQLERADLEGQVVLAGTPGSPSAARARPGTRCARGRHRARRYHTSGCRSRSRKPWGS